MRGVRLQADSRQVRLQSGRGVIGDSGVRTAGAKPVELQLGAIDPCGCNAGSLAVDRVSDVLQINIGDAAAARADEMVVIVGFASNWTGPLARSSVAMSRARTSSCRLR